MNSDYNWSEAEMWAWDQIRNGKIADFNLRCGDHLDPTQAEPWGTANLERRIGATFLDAILTRDPHRSLLPRNGVRIFGAVFDEPVDLAHARLDRQLWLEHCRFQNDLNLTDTFINGWLSLEYSWICGNIHMDEARIEGFTSLTGARAKTLSAIGVRIDGRLQMSGLVTDGLNMQNAKVHGHVLLNAGGDCGAASVRDETNLSSVYIGGSLILCGARFHGPVDMTAIEVGDRLLLHDEACFKEQVKLYGARLGGIGDATDSSFHGRVDMSNIGFIILLTSPQAEIKSLWWLATASFDHLLPLIELDGEHSKFILTHLNGWALAYFHLHKLMGWILGSFVVAGLAGLTQR